MPKKVVQFHRIGEVTFSRNKRSKNIKISVKPNKKVLVSFPFFVRTKEAMAFVVENEQWIRKQQNKFETKRIRFQENSTLNTRLHNIVFCKGEKTKAEINGSAVKISISDFDDELENQKIEYFLAEIYRIEAKRILPGRLAEIAQEHGFNYNKVTIRNNRRNWGSCSSKNNISLNLQMMKLPDELINYILLHELVHTEIKNHSPKFWKRMDELTENRARELAKKVKQFSAYAL
jgi:predicted metal-dependent hydrolase